MSIQQYLLFSLLTITSVVNAFPTAKITIKVVDETGSPIANADAGINFETPKPLGQGAGININRKSGKTDFDGLFTAEGETTPQVSLGASHKEFYPSSSKFKQFTGVSGFLAFRRHKPWNPTVELVLKKVLNPIPMYAVQMSGGRPGEFPEIPVVGRFVGYDLAANDWVAPYGLGTHRDFLFRLDIERAVSINDHDVTLTLRFSRPGDGLLEYTPDISKGKSILRFPHHAPVNGYKDELVQHYERTPGVSVTGSSGYPEFETNYFFRVRTKLDNDGNVIGGLYGKIHGPINAHNYTLRIKDSNPFLSFNYYLNPNDNDTNIEYDPTKNLFKGVPHRKKVADP